MKKEKLPIKKLIIDEETSYDIVALKTIESSSKNIWVDEISNNKIKFLISNNIFNGDLNLLKGLKFIRGEGGLQQIELVGLDIFLDIKKATILHITKKLFFIEEFEDNCFRLTFTESFIRNIYDKETLIIE